MAIAIAERDSSVCNNYRGSNGMVISRHCV